ncbi:hypothetical protein SDC9_208011 [bioreactor metagenome]|uniref:Uncharacterized protein n=1 Tax=bioreactor metagenome TaxID=1076179 RepID=A0A645J9B9_9ZZZZ
MPYRIGFFFVDGEIEIVPDGFIIAVHNVRDAPLFRIHFFAKLDTLRSVGAFLLRQRPKDGQHKFAVAQYRHICGQEQRFNI